MSSETASLIVAVMIALGAWTATIATLTLWLSNRFRTIEQVFYTELGKFRKETEAEHRALDSSMRRIEFKVLALEIRTGGYAEVGGNGGGNGSMGGHGELPRT